MCARWEDLGAGKCETEGHSMEYGDGQPDDFCSHCGVTAAQLSFWDDEVRKANLAFARAVGSIGSLA